MSRRVVVLSVLLILDNFLVYSCNLSRKEENNITSLDVHSHTRADSLKISKLELWRHIPQRRKDITSEWYSSVEPIEIKCLCHSFDTYRRLIKV